MFVRNQQKTMIRQVKEVYVSMEKSKNGETFIYCEGEILLATYDSFRKTMDAMRDFYVAINIKEPCYTFPLNKDI